MLHQFIFHKVNQDEKTVLEPIGVFVAYGKDEIGWALCKRGSKFDQIRGLTIAAYRALRGGVTKKFPESLMPQYDKFIDRVNRYFKPGFVPTNDME